MTTKTIKIAVVGCMHGELDTMYVNNIYADIYIKGYVYILLYTHIQIQ